MSAGLQKNQPPLQQPWKPPRSLWVAATAQEGKGQPSAWPSARRCHRNSGQETINSAWQRTPKVTMQKTQETPTGSREQFSLKGMVLGQATTGTQLHSAKDQAFLHLSKIDMCSSEISVQGFVWSKRWVSQAKQVLL